MMKFVFTRAMCLMSGLFVLPVFAQEIVAIKASGNEQGNVPAHVLDGRPATRWAVSGVGHWIQFEFDQPIELERLDVLFYKGTRKYAFEVNTSDDGKAFTKRSSFKSSGAGEKLETFTLPKTKARFLRLVMQGNSENSWNSMYSVSIPGVKPAAKLASSIVQQPSSAKQKGKGGMPAEMDVEIPPVPPAPVLETAEALQSFKVAPGFRVELVAAEPMVENPVCMAWDGDANLWVVEMRGYMPDAYGKTETQLKTGRVTVCFDRDGDGLMDDATIFLDGLIMPRAISMVKGGVLVAEPPNLWYCRDTDGDFVCDSKTNVATYARQGPVEHTDNALLPAIDNHIYNAKSSRRFRFVDGKIIEDKTRGRGQWALSMDNYGRLYHTSNSRYLSGDWGTYKLDKFGFGIGDSRVYSIRPNPGINRGYRNGMLGDRGRLNRITAISGPGVYRGDVYGDEYVGDVFICEPAANVVALFDHTDEDKLSFTHKTYDDPEWTQRDFLASTDERFRPVSLYSGPDGCMQVVDLYHGILQHKVYITPYLRKQIFDRKLDGLNNDRGRIYRIVPEGVRIRDVKPKLQQAPSAVLVKTLSHPNGWHRDTAQRLLVERQDVDVVPLLEQAVLDASRHLAQIHALWTLHGMHRIRGPIVLAALKDPHPKVRLTGLAVADQVEFPAEKKILIGALEALSGDDGTRVQTLAGQVRKILAGEAVAEEVVQAPSAGDAFTGELAERYRKGKDVYALYCGNCHQPHGNGLVGLAPPLNGSEWVADEKRLILVALDGLIGPIQVAGKDYPTLPAMPGHKLLLKDQQIADVLTYIRNTWKNKGQPVAAETVTQYRKASGDRLTPWEAEELKALP